MTKINVKTGDNVLVIAGSKEDKGKISVVSATSPKTGKVCVEGVNMQTKHQKARKANEKSEIIKKEGFIDISNVMVVCPSCNKATRVARKIEDGKSIRVCKKCGASLDTNKNQTYTKGNKTKASTAGAKKAKSTKVAKVKESKAKTSTQIVATRGDK